MPTAEDIYLYLQKFHIENGEPRYHPEPSTQHYESNIRNFLIELGIVSHNADGDYYYVTPGHIDLYVAAHDSDRRRSSPSSRASMQADRESLGTAAEELILEYERKRVGVEYQHEVQHIAVVDTAAGYDIKSVDTGAVRKTYTEIHRSEGSPQNLPAFLLDPE